MRIGLISDTHNKLKKVQLALACFRSEGIQTILHAGDITGPTILEALAGVAPPTDDPPYKFDVWLVWGNMDHHPQLASTAQTLFGPGRLARTQKLTLDGARIALTHGDAWDHLQTLIHTGDADRRPYDYVIHGHTHKPKDERVHNTRVINPGALGNADWRSPTYAILDLATDDLQWFRA
jgi:hypothetical protein